jgi:hypothetical protein
MKPDTRKQLPIDEKIQLLDQVLNGVWVLGEAGGRYQRAVSAFKGWVHQVAEIRAAQRQNDVDALLARGGGGFFADDEDEDAGTGLFVSDLDASAWKRDHTGLVRVLEGWRRVLAQLGDVDVDPDAEEDKGKKPPASNGGEKEKAAKSRSGLARTLGACRSLVHDMLAELEVMEQIERDALAVEEEWIENMEARLHTGEEEDSRNRRTEDVPLWKLLVF